MKRKREEERENNYKNKLVEQGFGCKFDGVVTTLARGLAASF